MSDEIYVKLGERLNENAFKLPPVGPVIEFLKELFTEQEAAFCAEFPVGAHTLEALAKHYSTEPQALETKLEQMADKFLIFVGRDQNQVKAYSLVPYAPGLIESQFMRGEENDKTRRVAGLFKQIMEIVEEMSAALLQDQEMAKEMMPPPGVRTLTVEEALPSKSKVYTYEKLTEMLKDETSFAATACPCWLKAKLVGHPCEIEDVPVDSCIYFGQAADYMVERDYARRLTREGLDDLLKVCSEKGLVHNLNNHLAPNIVLCNCCGCCCNLLGTLKKIPGFGLISVSNFIAKVDKDTCIGCGECEERCPMDAIAMANEIAAIDPVRCIGCGNCVSVCPEEVLSMIRRKEEQPPDKSPEIVGLGL